MNPKKKLRRCRASVSIQALDLAISVSPTALVRIHADGLIGQTTKARVQALVGPVQLN
jgi:hypothetical protein